MGVRHNAWLSFCYHGSPQPRKGDKRGSEWIGVAIAGRIRGIFHRVYILRTPVYAVS